MKKYLLILLSFFWSGALFAQNNKSFFRDISKDEELEAFEKVSRSFQKGLNMEVGSFLEGYFIEGKLSDSGINFMMRNYSIAENNSKVLSIFEQWKSSFVSEDDIVIDEIVSNMYRLYADALHKKGNFLEAITSYQKSLVYQAPDKEMALKYQGIALCYMNMGMYNHTIRYLDMAISYYLSFYGVKLDDIANENIKDISGAPLSNSLGIKGFMLEFLNREKESKYYLALAAAMGNKSSQDYLKGKGINYKKYLKRIKNK